MCTSAAAVQQFSLTTGMLFCLGRDTAEPCFEPRVEKHAQSADQLRFEPAEFGCAIIVEHLMVWAACAKELLSLNFEVGYSTNCSSA
jgi:hypothetical protein